MFHLTVGRLRRLESSLSRLKALLSPACFCPEDCGKPEPHLVREGSSAEECLLEDIGPVLCFERSGSGLVSEGRMVSETGRGVCGGTWRGLASSPLGAMLCCSPADFSQVFTGLPSCPGPSPCLLSLHLTYISSFLPDLIVPLTSALLCE